jgi:hypothetical protein
MTKLPMTIQLEEDGNVININLTNAFLDFYKKETNHNRITKKGVTKFLKNLLDKFSVGWY